LLTGVWGHHPPSSGSPHIPTYPRNQPERTVPPPRSFLRRSVSGPDPGPGSSSGSGANPLHNSCFNRAIFETGHFNQEKTVQFSGPVPVAKNRPSTRSSGNPPGSAAPLWPKNNRGSRVPVKGRLFSRKRREMPAGREGAAQKGVPGGG